MNIQLVIWMWLGMECTVEYFKFLVVKIQLIFSFEYLSGNWLVAECSIQFNFVHYDFLIQHNLSHTMKDVSLLR